MSGSAMNEWIVQALIASSLLLALVLVLRAPVARAFGARAAYALWALPALRLLLPSLPGWQPFYVPVFRLDAPDATIGLVDPATAVHMRVADFVAPHGAAPIVQAATIPWGAMLVAAWLGIALLWFAWQMLRYRAFLAAALRPATLLTRECGVDILLTDHVDGPVAAGLLRRRIFLPADFPQRYGPAERRLALLHEGAHHDRGDILANLVALAVLALHWWNPLAHHAYRAFRADQELACDATVLAGVDREDAYAYGSAVLKSVSARMPGVACALSHKAELKRRLVAMRRPAIGSARSWLGAAVAIAAIGGGLLVTASGSATIPPVGTIPSAAEIARIETEARAVEREGRRAAEQARAEGRRAVDQSRAAAHRARAEALREAARAHAEAIQARATARAAQVVATREIAQQDVRSLAETRHMRDEALRDAEQVRAEAARNRDAALAAQVRGMAARNIARREVASARASLAAQCAAGGHPVSADLPWDRLALCGDNPQAIARRAVAEARRGMAASLPSEE